MDDDFGFGASVWATPSSSGASTSKSVGKALEPSYSAFPSTNPLPDVDGDTFDDDDFDAPIQATVSIADDDDFGDFGDFGEAGEGGDTTLIQPSSFQDSEQELVPGHSADWDALRLDPLPSTLDLKTDIGDILRPLWGSVDASQFLTDENIRQVGGLSQILVTSESRSLYKSLFQPSIPNTQPPNWTRSRIRRRHLVSLGIPVNLDEVLPHVNGKPMPALQITARPSSAPPGPRGLSRVASPPPASAGSSRPGTPKPSPSTRTSAAAQLSLGPKPDIDEDRIAQALALNPDSLALLPLPTLEAHLASMRSLTASTSSLLTHLLQQRDALQQDSETYNGLIAELVGEAQKQKSGAKTRTGGSRRTSGMS